MDDSDVSGRTTGGLFDSLRSLLATLVAMAHTRVELFGTELEEELHRVVALAVPGFLFGDGGQSANIEEANVAQSGRGLQAERMLALRAVGRDFQGNGDARVHIVAAATAFVLRAFTAGGRGVDELDLVSAREEHAARILKRDAGKNNLHRGAAMPAPRAECGHARRTGIVGEGKSRP